MSDAKSVAVAKAMAARIDDLELDAEIYTLRNYAEWDLDLSGREAQENPAFELTDATTRVRIDVVAHTTEQLHELETQGTLRFELPMDVGVRRKFSKEEQDATTGLVNISEVDRLVKVVEDIHVALTRVRLADLTGAVWQSTKVVACPVRHHLRVWRQFTGILRVTFRYDLKLPQNAYQD